MRSKQVNPMQRRKGYRLYSPTAMTNAYLMVKQKTMSVKKASRVFRVPDTTLRDRVLGKVDPDTAVFGKSPVLSQYEEAHLVKHFKTMASYGYGYTRQECVHIASDYAVQIGKRTSDKPFTIKWIRGFLKRWPELRVLKPRGLEHLRAKMASREVVEEYFQCLHDTLIKNNLIDKPHLIFNVDEKGISVDHKPPHVVADSTHCPQSVTSGRGKNVTVLGGGSASGVAIPPFFVFPGKRMIPDLMEGSSPGADGTVSETGWSNGIIFRHYLEHHFVKYVPGLNQPILLLLDGHRSHVSVDLTEWAKSKGIIIFILPAHTSHVLQPMDVACYGPFERIYNNLCHKFMRQTSTTITRYNVCEMACKVYLKALSPENIQSGFKRTGIFPFNSNAVPNEHLAPATVFSNSTVQHAADSDNDTDKSDCYIDFLSNKEEKLKEVKRTVKKERNTISKIVSGKAITETVFEKMKEHEESNKYGKKSETGNKKQTITSTRKQTKSTKTKSLTIKQICPFKMQQQQPGPSVVNLSPSRSSSSESESESDVDPSELCCKCNRFQPEELKKCTSLVFTKWAQCDKCNHWVHLIYCTSVRVVRRGDSFFCHHCKPEE